MRVVFPKHIKKGILAWMTFNIGPIQLSIVQLFILAIGIAAWLGIFNAVSKSWSKILWLMLAIPIVLVFLAVAFFKMSELSLTAFIAKKVRNNFFDTPKKYQVNFEKINPTTIIIQKIKYKDTKKTFTQKEQTKYDSNKIADVEHWWLI